MHAARGDAERAPSSSLAVLESKVSESGVDEVLIERRRKPSRSPDPDTASSAGVAETSGTKYWKRGVRGSAAARAMTAST
jgi:hypothetical protein